MKHLDSYRIYANRIAGILCAFFIFNGIIGVLNDMYNQGETRWMCRILWHDFYESDGKIENVYLGSSHVYCDINPMQLDDINGQSNFNLSSPAQNLRGSFYLLKEADKNNVLSHVYLELYYGTSMDMGRDISTDWQNIDYMKTSYNKCRYILSITDCERYINILFPFSRYRTKLDDWDYIRQTMEAKTTDEYLNYKYYFSEGKRYQECKGNGYWYSTWEFLDEQRLYKQDKVFIPNPIGEKSEEYLRMIVSYCQKQNIPITLFLSPIDELQLISTEHYDNYINQVRKIAEEYDVDFYDFNLAKEEYLDIQHGKYFQDMGHLNGKGADVFTSFFGSVVSKTPSENEKYFYESYEEKLRSTAPAIYGLYYRDLDGFRTYHIASNRESGMEYRITLTPAPDELGGGGTDSLTGLHGEQSICSFQG